MKTIICVILFCGLAFGFFKVIESGIAKAEKLECEKLLKQAESVGDIWFASDWQYNMCLNYNISLK